MYRPYNIRTVERKLRAAGFELISQKRHKKFIKDTAEGRRTVIVPHCREVKAGTLRSIASQAGMTPDEFARL